MKFSIFHSTRSPLGTECTADFFNDATSAEWVKKLLADIAKEPDKEKRAKLKNKLPVITWQAYFPGRRVNTEAQPSGLFMLDIDHVENPYKIYTSFCGRVKELGIVFVAKTPSTKGLRVVARCRPEFTSIAECQKWLAKEIGVDEFDEACKDWARCSYLVHFDYFYYLDNSIFTEEPAPGTVYAGGANPVQVNAEMEEMLSLEGAHVVAPAALLKENAQDGVDQREGLFGGDSSYKGIPYTEIIKEWFDRNGGEPVEGDRNTKLYQLATRLRYITDFSAATMVRVMPAYGLPPLEIRTIINNALSSTRASRIPNDMQAVIDSIQVRRTLLGTPEDESMPELSTKSKSMPSLPPVFRQFHEIAPHDFKDAVVLAQLPILGTLGSRLRARYLDGKLHSPSFQVSLEAPQASGKSFLGRLVEYELGQVIEHDELEREKEREYQSKMQEMKVLNIKITPDNKEEILGARPQSLIRYVPATMSITKMLMRMSDAHGLHLFAFAPELDTVHKAFKRGFSSLSDALRMAFDNDLYGQDYASDSSFSGNVRLFYNCLYSGTPRAMRRFYPDVEDGLVSRVLFVVLPDQFGKKMPVWKEFDSKQKGIVDINLTRLNEITIQGDDVQPEHIVKIDFVNQALEDWIVAQQAQAVKENDRTRDIFCRRAAVVGFRAAMLAFFLWGEKNTPTIRKNTIEFAIYVANAMLTQHLLRFKINSYSSNTTRWEDIYNELPNSFTRVELENILKERDVNTPWRNIVYHWRLAGIVKDRDVEGTKVFTKCNETVTPDKKHSNRK